MLIFTRTATQLTGVVRIALIGSLTTNKPDPKDADMLVTVANNADLVHLAALGRKLQGHAQSINRGGEVFLADSQNNYLGRTCPWKQCGPGTRASFEALNCGKRPFLHDYLSDISLSKRVIAQPPVELWLEIVTRIPVPDNLAKIVTRPLQEKL